MSFMFTPGCCCSVKCPSCQSLLDSGARIPSVPAKGWGNPEDVISQVKQQTGRSCQFGYLKLWAIYQDKQATNTPVSNVAYNITYFDDVTGKTKLDGNGDIYYRETSIQKKIENYRNKGFTLFYAAWRKCEHPLIYSTNVRMDYSPGADIVSEDDFDLLSVTAHYAYRLHSGGTYTYRAVDIPRNGTETAREWVERALQTPYFYTESKSVKPTYLDVTAPMRCTVKITTTYDRDLNNGTVSRYRDADGEHTGTFAFSDLSENLGLIPLWRERCIRMRCHPSPVPRTGHTSPGTWTLLNEEYNENDRVVVKYLGQGETRAEFLYQLDAEDEFTVYPNDANRGIDAVESSVHQYINYAKNSLADPWTLWDNGTDGCALAFSDRYESDHNEETIIYGL